MLACFQNRIKKREIQGIWAWHESTEWYFAGLTKTKHLKNWFQVMCKYTPYTLKPVPVPGNIKHL